MNELQHFIPGQPHYEAVLRGMAWLDQKHPGWFDQINISQLDMNHTNNDICGQLGINRFHRQYDQNLGFYFEDGDDDLSKLTETWVEAIQTRCRLPNLPEGYVCVGWGTREGGAFPLSLCRFIFFEENQIVLDDEDWWPYDGKECGRVPYCFYISRFGSPAAQHFNIEALNMSNESKEYRIHPNGRVSFRDFPAISADEAEAFVKWFFDEPPRLAGHAVESNLANIRVGCQTIDAETVIQFCHEYREGMWKKPEGFKVGQKFRHTSSGLYHNGVAVIQKFSSLGGYALICLSEEFGNDRGKSWNGNVQEVKDPNNIRLEEFSANPSDWQPID